MVRLKTPRRSKAEALEHLEQRAAKMRSELVAAGLRKSDRYMRLLERAHNALSSLATHEDWPAEPHIVHLMDEIVAERNRRIAEAGGG